MLRAFDALRPIETQSLFDETDQLTQTSRADVERIAQDRPLFHSLVERKLVKFDIGCTSTGSNIDNIEDLRNFLEQTPLIKCDEISFSIFGLSLANLNFVISTLLIMLSYYILKKI